MRISRIDELEQYIIDHKSVSMDTLCHVFRISKNTVRRDLEVLIERGTVEKVYGGVIASENAAVIPELISFQERASQNSKSKQKIAALASTFIHDRDIIFIDSGTTTMYTVDHLSHLNSVTVITASIPVINKAMNYPNINLIVLPGTIKRNSASIVGSSCVEYLEDYNIVAAFMACTGLSADTGVCNSSTDEYSIKRAALKKSQKHYLLADSAKFGRTSLMTYGQISNFDYILTEQLKDESFRSYCKEHNCIIETVSDEAAQTIV